VVVPAACPISSPTFGKRRSCCDDKRHLQGIDHLAVAGGATVKVTNSATDKALYKGPEVASTARN
jgi:hypothetical protein